MLDIEHLERSFATIQDRGSEFTAVFYNALFANCPEVKPLFQQVDMQEQGKKLFASLALVVSNLHNPDTLITPLMAMGARHRDYGVTPEHYPIVGQAMLQALETTLGADWTTDLQQSWLEAYRMVAEVMQQGANRSTVEMKPFQVLQGEFQVKELNLLLVFQVNCPGCFVYALPLAARLHDQYSDRLNVLGLSTAFEDFDLNTPDNTRRLLESGEVVGMTKLYLQQHGESPYSVPLRFPVAFDGIEGDQPVSKEQTSPIHPSVGQTFRSNRLQGTPSWILFDESFTILEQWFGHKSESAVESILHQWLAASSVHDTDGQSV